MFFHITSISDKGLSVTPQSRGKEFVQCGHFADKRCSSDADVRTYLYQKLCFFLNLWCVRTGKGAEQLQTFGGQEGGIDFSRFCANVFYERPL